MYFFFEKCASQLIIKFLLVNNLYNAQESFIIHEFFSLFFLNMKFDNYCCGVIEPGIYIHILYWA